MKKSIGMMVCVMLFFTLLIGCSSGKKTEKAYSNNEIEFFYPAEWKIVDSPDLIIKPEVMVQDADSGANINLVVEQVAFLAPSAADCAEQAVQNYEQLGKNQGIQDYEKLGFEEVTVGNIKAGILSSEFTMTQNNVRLRNKQLLIPLGQKIYTLTATCSVDQWTEFEPTFNKVIESFGFKNN